MANGSIGRVIFVGAGPGADDLLTVRAIRALAKADVVLHDALGASSSVLDWCDGARLVPVGKRAGKTSTEQVFISRRLVQEALQGHLVIRLKGGDPSIFGRLDEEIEALREAGIHYEIVPGITAASAAAAAAGLPLTQRGVSRSLTLTTPATARGVAADADWLKQCDPAGTVAVYMAGRQLTASASALINRGFSPTTPVLLACDVSTAAERLIHCDLQTLVLRGAQTLASQLSNQSADSVACLLMVGDALIARGKSAELNAALSA